MKWNLGDRYYRIDGAGQVTAHVVLDLPFTNQEAFFDLHEAVAVAKSRLEETLTIHAADSNLSSLLVLRELMVNDEQSFKMGLESAPVYFYQPTAGFGDPVVVDVEAIPSPGLYFRDGTIVFAAISPNTHAFLPRPLGPAPFFVLETTVRRVSWGQHGLRYMLDNEFQPSNPLDICPSLSAAKERLGAIIKYMVPSKPEHMLVHTIEDEQKRREESEQHRSGRLSAGAD